MYKLIRDNIPEIIKSEGKQLHYATVEDNQFYFNLLLDKLKEEFNEYFTDYQVEELVDIVTVINYILKVYQVDEETFKELYNKKLEERGGFDKRYLGFFYPELEQTESNE